MKSDVDETWVSSEDNEILNVSEKYNARIIERPNNLASDTATSESVLLHFAQNVDFNILVFIQATSPLISFTDINNGIRLMKKYDSVLSVTGLTQFIWSDGKPNYDINNRKRRQETSDTFLETGSFFITTRDNLLKSKNRISGNIGFCEIPRIRSFDIDTYDDLNIVRKLMKMKDITEE